jgi:glycosyltransferase involved in cell wall biosynthesis
MSQEFTTAGGRTIRVVGAVDLVTAERIAAIGQRFDADPQVVTVSLVSEQVGGGVCRATGPAGPVTCVALDAIDLVGPLTMDLQAWCAAARDRGLVHEWWGDPIADARARPSLPRNDLDVQEETSPSSRHFVGLHPRQPRTLSVAIDVSWLGPHETGAQTLTTAATQALARHPRIESISLRGAENLPGYAEHLLDDPRVTLGGTSRCDVCWFPNQIDFRSNLGQARQWGSRVVTTYLDLIAYSIPRYHASPEAWRAYRSLQRIAALASDGITTISADVARHLMEEVPLLDPVRLRPIPLGMDHIQTNQLPPSPPSDVASLAAVLGERPFVLVLGNDFVHKNRDFAISVWQELLRAGVACDLVLAGLHVRGSSSREEETRVLNRHVDLRGRVHTLDHVSSTGRTWLLAHAAAVLYPSSAEGFGLVPYEAAVLGTPSVFTRFGPLAEISRLGDVPTGWSITQYTSDLAALVTDADAAARRVAALRDAAARYTWTRFGDNLVDFMYDVCALPLSPAGAVMTEAALDAAALNALLASRTWRATAPVRRLARRLRGFARE